MNKFDQMREAVAEAKNTMQAADAVADSMARMLTGRLSKVNSYTLTQLKKELRDFNMHTGTWRDKT